MSWIRLRDADAPCNRRVRVTREEGNNTRTNRMLELNNPGSGKQCGGPVR
jgi:hypothetical protein